MNFWVAFLIFSAMKSSQVDFLNTFLIIISMILAYWLPIELFLIAYALLGPLHYLTEINWVREKKYFAKSNSWKYWALGIAILYAVPTILKLPFFESFLKDSSIYTFLTTDAKRYINGLLFFALVMAISNIAITNKTQRLLAIAIGGLLAVFLNQNLTYNILVGIFLPTVIHVYLFTWLFMLYGNLKTHNKLGYFNIALVAAAPLVFFLVQLPTTGYTFTPYVKDIFLNNNFHVVNAHLAKFLGLTEQLSFFFYETLDLKVQMFIAFAYTYHYLNWFSKTTVIGWHKKLTTKRTLLILLIWVASVLIYAIDYKVGLGLLLFLSVLHVILEFPINVHSIRGIWQAIFK